MPKRKEQSTPIETTITSSSTTTESTISKQTDVATNVATTEQIVEDRHYPTREPVVVEFHISKGTEPVRIDVWLTTYIKHATRNKVQEGINQGSVRVNGKQVKVSYKVQPGDHIVCTLMKRPPLELVPEDIPLDIVYEDEDVLVINKPAGMVVHPALGNRYGTIVNAALYHFGQRQSIMIDDMMGDDSSEESDGESDEEILTELNGTASEHEVSVFDSDAMRPGIVHRIDKETTGLLVIGKNTLATQHLCKQFFDRTTKRVYHAIVWGITKNDTEVINADIGRSSRNRKLRAVLKEGGKTAITEYTTLARYDFCSFIQLQLKTGRTHQIRVHMAHLHYPLMGDKEYGGDSLVYGGIKGHHRSVAHKCLDIMQRQALHATLLGFTHPRTGEWMEFTSELPSDMSQVLTMMKELHGKTLSDE